jgi:hypothetical protein
MLHSFTIARDVCAVIKDELAYAPWRSNNFNQNLAESEAFEDGRCKPNCVFESLKKKMRMRS